MRQNILPGFLLLALLAAVTACGPQSGGGTPVPTELIGGTELTFQASCDASSHHCSSEQLARIPDVVVAFKQRMQNSLGIAQPAVRQQGADEIIVDLPPAANKQQALTVLGKLSKLEFIDTGANGLTVGQPVPAGSNYRVVFTGDQLDPNSIQAMVDQQSGQPTILFAFTTSYQSDFAHYTQQNIGNYLTILLDETVIVSAVIESQITGQAEIPSPDKTLAATQQTAALMRCAALPVPLTLVSQHTISG
jgi:preprotein translocase subunit SecD